MITSSNFSLFLVKLHIFSWSLLISFPTVPCTGLTNSISAHATTSTEDDNGGMYVMRRPRHEINCFHHVLVHNSPSEAVITHHTSSFSSLINIKPNRPDSSCHLSFIVDRFFLFLFSSVRLLANFVKHCLSDFVGLFLHLETFF